MAKLSELDGQNRISLTAEQMAYAGINSEVTFVGDGKRVRLWAPEKFAQEIEGVSEEDEKKFENWF
jgi:DNA-binding transcriptional regulator/RsmH inhibitor MraZ